MGNIDRDVIKAAPSWAEGLNNYQRQKHQHLFEGETPKPFYVTRHFKSREEAAVNPITQKFNDHDIEHTLKTMEQTGLNRSLNRAWDKQLLREQHFDVITQQPKKGHVHEVPYVQRLKPPSLVTANHVAYNILSGKGLDEHHWAAPGKRPDRIPTPPRKEPFVTAVNKPREVNLLNGRYIDHHEERTKWEMDRNREAVVDKFWETHDFNPVSCSYYDQEKELYYQKRIKEMLLSQGSNAISKLPPTLAASESLMYDICTGVVKDPVRLRQKIEADRIALENRASKIGAEERMRLGGDVRQDIAAERQLARVSHNRYLDVTARGFHIITNSEFDKDGLRRLRRRNCGRRCGNSSRFWPMTKSHPTGLGPACSKIPCRDSSAEWVLRRANDPRALQAARQSHRQGVGNRRVCQVLESAQVPLTRVQKIHKRLWVFPRRLKASSGRRALPRHPRHARRPLRVMRYHPSISLERDETC